MKIMALTTQSSYPCEIRSDILAPRMRQPPDTRNFFETSGSSNSNSKVKICGDRINKKHLGFRIRYAPKKLSCEGRKEASSKTKNNKYKEFICVRSNDKNVCEEKYANRSCHHKIDTCTKENNLHEDNAEQLQRHSDVRKSKDIAKYKEQLKSMDMDLSIFRENRKENNTKFNEVKFRNDSTGFQRRSQCVDYTQRQNCGKGLGHDSNKLSCTKEHQMRLDASKRDGKYCSCERIQIQVEADESFELNCDVKDNSEDNCICSDNDDDGDTFYTSLACSSLNLNDLSQEEEPLNRSNRCVSHKERRKSHTHAHNSHITSKTQCTKNNTIKTQCTQKMPSKTKCTRKIPSKTQCTQNIPNKTQCTQNIPNKTQCTKEELRKEENHPETNKPTSRRGICSYIFSPFSSYTAEQNKSCEKVNKSCTSPDSSNIKPDNFGKKPSKSESKKYEKDALDKIFEELECLKHEVENMKSSCQKQVSLSDVKFLIKENRTLKRNFEKFRRSFERDREKSKMSMGNQCHNNRKLECSMGDTCELSKGCNEVMDVMSQKLASVLKRFHHQETMVCEKSTSFTKFTDHYRQIIEDYCRNLSTRVNDWFECKRKKIEQREEKLKREYQTCVDFMETEKEKIGDKVNKIKAKFEEYEKHIEQRMNKLPTKYESACHNMNDKAMNKPGCCRTLKPKCQNLTEEMTDECKYPLIMKKIGENHSLKPRKHLTVCHESEKKHKYKNCSDDYEISRKYTPVCERTNYQQKSKSLAPYRNTLKDYSTRNHFVTYDTQIYEMPTKIIYSKASYQHPKKSHSVDHCIPNTSQDKVQNGEYSVFNKIKDYFEAANKSLKSESPATPSVITLTDKRKYL